MNEFIPLCVPEIKGNELEYVSECIKSGWVSATGGEYLDKFEALFSEYTGIKYSNAVINGTAALHLALEALKIGEGDEVIIPSLTFISTANVVKYAGAKIVFVDVKLDDYTIDPKEIEKAITKKTKAIIPVHLYGSLCDMDQIMKIAEKHKLFVIEDATEALGGFIDGKMAGAIGHIGCFSFNGNKLITTGAGGMISCDDKMLNERIDYLKNQTKSVLQNGAMFHNEIGFNYRMPNLLAAFGAAQMENIKSYVDSKEEIYKFYKNGLEGLVVFPEEKLNQKVCRWLSSFRVSSEVERDRIIAKTMEEGIMCRPFFMPLHSMKPFSEEKVVGSMENTVRLSKEGINIPSSVGLEHQQIKRVVELLKKYVV